jgi:hypothetical protein
LRRKCWSVVNFIEAVSAPHSSSEICQPLFENAGTRPVRTQHKDNSFYGKRNIAKFTRSTIWGVQLKSGDIIELMNLMLAGFKLREQQN